MNERAKMLGLTLRQMVFGLVLAAAFSGVAGAQEIVDRTVAVVNDGLRHELITYSDMMWQLALQPNAPLNPPRADDLNAVLVTLINQRIFALEAERLPRAAPTEKEITNFARSCPAPSTGRARRIYR